jgi:hypothetical protein
MLRGAMVTAAGQARWKPGEKYDTQVQIVTGTDEDTWLTIRSPGSRPVPGMLAPYGWYNFPGTEWKQERDGGEWVLDVFHFPAQSGR